MTIQNFKSWLLRRQQHGYMTVSFRMGFRKLPVTQCVHLSDTVENIVKFIEIQQRLKYEIVEDVHATYVMFYNF